MTSWEDFVFSVPDDGGRTLARIVAAMPQRFEWDYTIVPRFGWRLRVNEVAAAVFLRLAVDGLGVADERHPFLEAEELFVPDSIRAFCEARLEEQCGDPDAVWSELVWVEFRTSEARVHFEALLRLDSAARTAQTRPSDGRWRRVP